MYLILKVLFLASLCLIAACFVCDAALVSMNTPSVHGEQISANTDYGIDDGDEVPVFPPPWP